MKYKLSKKAQAYLKAQEGLQVPYEYPYQDNTTPFDLGQIDPNLQSAQQNQIANFNPNPNYIKLGQPQQNQQNQNSGVLDKLGSLGSLGSTIKIGTGIVSLFQAAKEKKKAKRREMNAEKDLERRMKESRENDFYYTGQSSGMYSDYNKKGGLIYQDGGFMDFYNQQQQQNRQSQFFWEDYYSQHVQEQKDKALQLKNQGWTDIVGGYTDQLNQAASVLSGGMMKDGGIISKIIKYQMGGVPAESTKTNILDVANQEWYRPITKTMAEIDAERDSLRFQFKKENPALFDAMMGKNPENMSKKRKTTYRDRFHEKQEGGIIEEAVDEDLYSENFQSPKSQVSSSSYFQEIMNKYQALDPQGSLENKAMSWIFEEEPEPKRYNISDVFGSGSNYNSSSVIDQIKANESGGNYSVVNPTTGTTGAYQFNPTYWGTQIRDFMGMSNVPINQVMEEFKNNPQAQDKFMEHVVNNVYKPEVEKLRPLAQRYGFSDNDLIKLLHYRGIGDTRKRLETGNFEVSQEEKRKYKNPDILKYLGK